MLGIIPIMPKTMHKPLMEFRESFPDTSVVIDYCHY